MKETAEERRTERQMSLRELRGREALTQEELSKRSGVSLPTIHELEHGKRFARATTRRKLAEALGVEPQSLAYLARESNRPPVKTPRQKTA